MKEEDQRNNTLYAKAKLGSSMHNERNDCVVVAVSIAANQPYYLGCVFAVVRHWTEAGRPCTKDLDHDMWQWAGALDWIVRHMFSCAPLMDGHSSAQERVSNPDMVWLRAVALAAVEDRRGGEELSASALVDLSESAAIDLPRTRGKYMDESQAARHVGKVLSRNAILAQVWGPERVGEPDLVKQYIYRLRQKIEPDPNSPQFIHSVRGEGYYFDVDDLT